MTILTHIIAFIVAVFVLVSFHEFGHFWVARRLGIKVLKYSIGFGKRLWHRTDKSGTEFVIAILPLGGYVKMLDEHEGKVDKKDLPYAFNRQALWKRCLVVLAGPIANLILAVFLFWFVYTLGLLQVKPIISHIESHSIAAKAGVKKEQEIHAVDGRRVYSWSDVSINVARRLGDKNQMTWQLKNQGEKQFYTAILNLQNWKINPLEPRIMRSLGVTPYQVPIPPIISQVVRKSPAEKAHLRAGDKVLKVNAKPVKDWRDMVRIVQKHPNQEMTFTLLRHGEILKKNVVSKKHFVMGFRRVGYIGVKPVRVELPADAKIMRQYPLWIAWWPALKQTGMLLSFNAIVFKKLITGKLSLKLLGGPITIFRAANTAFIQGVVVYLSFLGLFSVMLAFVNLLPIPGLDGGHLLFYLVEAIVGKALSRAAILLLFRLGLIFIIVIMVQATINDLWRLF